MIASTPWRWATARALASGNVNPLKNSATFGCSRSTSAVNESITFTAETM